MESKIINWLACDECGSLEVCLICHNGKEICLDCLDACKDSSTETDECVNPDLIVCDGCPFWDDVNGCLKGFVDVCDCAFVDETFLFNEKNYEAVADDIQLKKAVDEI